MRGLNTRRIEYIIYSNIPGLVSSLFTVETCLRRLQKGGGGHRSGFYAPTATQIVAECRASRLIAVTVRTSGGVNNRGTNLNTCHLAIHNRQLIIQALLSE